MSTLQGRRILKKLSHSAEKEKQSDKNVREKKKKAHRGTNREPDGDGKPQIFVKFPVPIGSSENEMTG